MTVAELIDRQAILDCVHRYARGVDRHDRALILSAYHPDATHTRGSFTGSPEAFADWVHERQVAGSRSHHHLVTNHVVEFDGSDQAHGETYYLAVSRDRADTHTTFSVGRYIDRFERRDGAWKIAVRIALRESMTRITSPPVANAEESPIRWDLSDISYCRPLTAPDNPAKRASP